MSTGPLRLEQYETVLYNSNLNPHGIPESVKKALLNSVDSINKYPDVYYGTLKNAVSEYVHSPLDTIITGNGSSDLLRLFAALISPKKSMVLVPSSTEYEKVLTAYGSEVTYYNLDEEKEFQLDLIDFLASLDSSIDMLVIGNPNNPTSKKIKRDDIETIAEVCDSLGIFLLIDEMYIEFIDNYEDFTAVPLVEKFKNMAILRSVSKFFAVPGIRFAYGVMNNPDLMSIIDATTTRNISVLSAIAAIEMFKDENYIQESRSTIHTERSLVYLAMSTCKTIKLIRPDANFMLMKILKDDITASDVYDHCKQRGVLIRKCDDITGLNNKYVRFCFMKPKQNDLMVNTILELM